MKTIKKIVTIFCSLLCLCVDSAYSRSLLRYNIGLRADGVPVSSAPSPQEIIKAGSLVHEKIDEVDLEKTTIVNMFGGTALALAGQLQRTPRVMAGIREVLTAKGRSEAEIAVAQQQARELMKNPEVATIMADHEAAVADVESEIAELEQSKEAVDQSNVTMAPKQEKLTAKSVTKTESTNLAEPTIASLQKQLASIDLKMPTGSSLVDQLEPSQNAQKIKTLRHKFLLKTAETVERFEAFLNEHPTVAKGLSYGVDGVRYALMLTGTKSLITAGLPKALVALGLGEALSVAESWAGEKVAGIVADAATSETEAKRFMSALQKCATTFGAVVGIKMVKGAIKPKISTVAKPVIKDALSEKAVVKDGKVWLGRAIS